MHVRVHLRVCARIQVEAIEQIFEGAVSSLTDEDAALPQVGALLPLLKAGVGIHHSGMLPLLRELAQLPDRNQQRAEGRPTPSATRAAESGARQQARGW